MKYSHLCNLISSSLHPLTAIITKQQEQSLLINLSQVLNKIKFWIDEFDSDNVGSLVDTSRCHSSSCECIHAIISKLVFLLTVESRYVRHLAGNVLVSVSEFVVASGSYWEEFVQTLFFYLQSVICKVISPSSDIPIRAKYTECESKDFKLVLDNAGWRSVGAIVLVLRGILKKWKDENDDEIVEVYLKALGSCLQNIPWDSCAGVPSVDIGDFFEFVGYLVQLFCSVFSTVDDSEDENPVVKEILDIFPKILTWCFGIQGENCNYTCTSQYIRHKILVLMIRLSSLVDLDCTMVVSWLHLIRQYFRDLLFESVNQPDADQEDYLKDSPFDGTSHQHLQRRVVFLYLKCAFSLIGVKETSKKQCLCEDVKSCTKKGFTALYEWLENQLPANILVDYELYDDSGRSFTKSFLQLYIPEDDMLFEVLLQLTYTQEISQDLTSTVTEKDIIFQLSDIFDPVHLFHIFLSELHYDHQVLLDYLISKDTGASCAKYLLRCLRIICDEWNSFVEFPFCVEVGRDSFHKRRKFKSDLESASDDIPLALEMDHKNESTCKQPFYDAHNCLLMLKKSVENLHQKDLFPYNPQVLLRRLTKFQELSSRL